MLTSRTASRPRELKSISAALRAAAITLALFLPLLQAKASFVITSPGSRPFGVAPPIFPTSASECNGFAAAVAEASKTLNKLHDDCLRSESKSGSRVSTLGKCSYGACEGFHNSSLSFSAESMKEVAQCHKQVSEVQRDIRQAFQAFSSIEAAQDSFSRLAPQAAKKMRSKVEEKLKEGLAKVFAGKVEPDITKASLSVAIELGKAKDECRREIGAARSVECEKQAYLTVSQLQKFAPVAASNDSIIKAIQEFTFERLNRVNKETIKLIEDMSQLQEPGDEGVSIGR